MVPWFALALAATCASTPSGEEVARQLAARAARDAQSTASTVFRKEWKEEDIADPENPRLTENKVWVLAGNGYRFTQQLTERSGKRLTHEPAESRTADARELFLARYTFPAVMPCAIQIGQQRLWVVSFAPRRDVPLPANDDEGELLNRMSGTLFIDADHWYVRYAYGELRTPFRVGLVGLGKVLRATIWMEQKELDGVPMLSRVSADITVKVFLEGQRHLRRIYQVFPQSEMQQKLSPLP